jgi:hypothetical protein
MSTHETMFLGQGTQAIAQVTRHGIGFARISIRRGRGTQEITLRASALAHHIKECEEMLASIEADIG